MNKFAAIATCLVCAVSAPDFASASSSDWFETDGGRVRLVTTGKPSADGRLTGILDIDLKPGWKTYWRDPGDAGVPPQIGIAASTNVTGAELAFPAPQRHDDGYAKWAGYDYPVALPVMFTLKSPDGPAIIDAEIFLGVCQTICIPVKTRLILDPARDPDNPEDAAAVARALAALPTPATPDFGVTVADAAKKMLVLEASLPEGASAANLFLAGAEGYAFGAPVKSVEDGKTLFSIEVLASPAAAPAGPGLHYTLVADAASVSGVLPYPK